jgi:MoxR-like ATPase
MASLEGISTNPVGGEGLEKRLLLLARTILGESGMDMLELRHLLEIMTRSSLLTSEDYNPATLRRILRGESRPDALLDTLPGRTGDTEEDRRFRIWGIPDLLRTCGDKCLYDVGLAGRRSFRGFDLTHLGSRSYSLASHVLESLADDRILREFYDLNQIERLPIEEEILFLRQCAARFDVYARILQAFRDEAPAVSLPAGPPPAGPPPTGASQLVSPSHPSSASIRADGADARREELPGLDREERLSQYERAILFSALDIARLRERMHEIVVDQTEAVDHLCDDLAVFALGTHGRARPRSYLLVGPTGVGKNHLIESLVGLLEGLWGIDVPLLLLEGPQYTHPSDVGELKGSTRGFIRSDEEGLLGEFHQRARLAPLSFILVDEIEKAHPQLVRFFLSLMDRGTTMDNRGKQLRFPATILAYTSNLGYSVEQMTGEPIGYGTAGRSSSGRAHAASRNLKRTLPPEFLNRLRVLHFAPLSRDSAERILDQEAARIAVRYRSLHGVEIALTRPARRALIDLGFSEEYGARRLVSQVDRVMNVEVSLKLHTAGEPMRDEGRRLLKRIREARQGDRAVDEVALQSEVARETRLRRPARRVVIDWNGSAFVHRVERV